MRLPGPRRLSVASAAALAGALALPAAASASTGVAGVLPLAFLGLPSLHSIIDAIARGFFGALAEALVPDFLKHGTVATIQHLVALPDPASWGHVARLQGDMAYLGAMLLPLALAVGTLRYWLLGFTGAAHPVAAVGRCAGASGALVAYRWIVEQAVAAANTLTHAILGFPAVGDGLQRIIAVLFGGALLTGAGGVFGAFLVIVGVLFAAGLFAVQVLLTLVLAVLIVAGPPLIALSAIPELSHLARAWAHTLLSVALVPLGWTVLFATAGALSLDATSFTGGAGGLPGHVAAAFAGLITFVIAVKLPLMLIGELRQLFGAGLRARGGAPSAQRAPLPGAERVRAAHARLRSAVYQGGPALGASVGQAAGALGMPPGGPLGAARRRLARAAQRSPLLGAFPGVRTGAAFRPGGGPTRERGGGVRTRVSRARVILANAPRGARDAMRSAPRNDVRATRQRRGSGGRGGAPADGTARGGVAAHGDAGEGMRAEVGRPVPRMRSGSERGSRTGLQQAQPTSAAQAELPITPQPTRGRHAQSGEQATGADAHPARKHAADAQREGGASPRQTKTPPAPKPQAKSQRQSGKEKKPDRSQREPAPPPRKQTPPRRRPRRRRTP